VPYDLKIPSRFKREGWKVKIQDNERLEPPHVTILRGPEKWRLGLRNGNFIVPPGGSWKQFPKGLRATV
jgi:hypothetical protein